MQTVYQTSTDKANLCFVVVPEGTYAFKMFPNGLFRYDDHYMQLPANRKWQIIAPLSEVTEEQAEKIVDEIFSQIPEPIFYKNYEDWKNNYFEAEESLYSLARSLNIPEGQNIVVLADFKNKV